MSVASGATREREACTGVGGARAVQACVRVLQAGTGIGAAWAHLRCAGRLLTGPSIAASMQKENLRVIASSSDLTVVISARSSTMFDVICDE